MIGAGVFLLVTGIVLWLYGAALNNDMDAQMNSLFENGKVNPGSTCTTLGIILTVIGLLVLIIGIVRYYQEKDRQTQFQNPNEINNCSDKCSNCGCQIPQGAAYCPQCGRKVDPQITCPVCGHLCPSTAAFCSQCGKKVGSTPDNRP